MPLLGATVLSGSVSVMGGVRVELEWGLDGQW